MGEARPTYSGPGRILVAVYAVFALAATARAGVQIATRFDEAPVAYLLSAFVVGTVSLAMPEAFPVETVWSGFGRGYGFVPLLLPVLGLLWLRRSAGDERVGHRLR